MPKWDGYRALLFPSDPGSVVQSRRGHDMTASFPDIAAAAVAQLSTGVVLDGEVVVWHDGMFDFAELQRRLVAPTLFPFGLVARWCLP